MIGNISKSKGFKGDVGEQGDTSNLYFGIDDNGNLYYETEYVPSLKTAPYIGADGHWYVFDGMTKKFYDTGIDARGEIPTEVIEAYIDAQTAIIRADIESLDNRITKSAHFKGYFSYNEEIQSSAATPNDFAYSAESGTVWIYEDMGDGRYAWVDSGTVVPDKAMQASDDLPLINGEAEAGESNEFARGDHRHPTDNTRLSVEEFEEFKNNLNDISDSSVFVVQFDTKNLTADKSYDEILAATKQYKTVMLYEGTTYLASLNNIMADSQIIFETHDIDNIMLVQEYKCTSFNEWLIVPNSMVNLNYFESTLNDTVGDIETALENIIAKYGLGGDAS